MVSLKSVLTANMLYIGGIGLGMMLCPLHFCEACGMSPDFAAVEPGSDLQAAINKSMFKVWGLILVGSASTMLAVLAGGDADTISMYGFANLLTWLVGTLDWWYVFVPAVAALGESAGGLRKGGAALQLGFIVLYLAAGAAAPPEMSSYPPASKVMSSLNAACAVYFLWGCAFYFRTYSSSSLYGLKADDEMLVLMNRCGFQCLLTVWGVKAVLAVRDELTAQKVNFVMICMWVAILSNMLSSTIISDLAGATSRQFEVDKIVLLGCLVLAVNAVSGEPRADNHA